MPKAKAASPRRTRASRENSARKAAQARGLGITRRGDLGEVAFVHKAMSLGYVVAKPYGQMHRYDFMVEGGNKLWRVQVKTSTCMRDHLYQLCVQRITHRRVVAYKKSELDFVVAYLMSEQTWFILPVSEVAGRRTILLPPREFPRKNSFAKYREAWHLLGKPHSPAEPMYRGHPQPRKRRKNAARGASREKAGKTTSPSGAKD